MGNREEPSWWRLPGLLVVSPFKLSHGSPNTGTT